MQKLDKTKIDRLETSLLFVYYVCGLWPLVSEHVHFKSTLRPLSCCQGN